MKKRMMLEILEKLTLLQAGGFDSYVKMIGKLAMDENGIEYISWSETIRGGVDYFANNLTSDIYFDLIRDDILEIIYINEADLIDADKSGIIISDPEYFYDLRGMVYGLCDVLNIIDEIRKKYCYSSDRPEVFEEPGSDIMF